MGEQVMKKLFDEWMQEKMPQLVSNAGQSVNPKEIMTPVAKAGTQKEKRLQSPLVKSPSDTPIYAPVFHKANNKELTVEQQVSDFVENVRNNTGRPAELIEPSTSRARPEEQLKSRIAIPPAGHAEAKRRMKQKMVEAEKHRTEVAMPSGECPMFETLQISEAITDTQMDTEWMQPGVYETLPLTALVGRVGNGNDGTALNPNFGQAAQTVEKLSDDDFFHLTCHIDQSLRAKIEKGEYVDLEKLLPKHKGRYSDDTKLEWVHREGGTFLVPASSERDNKINGIRRWDQAFCVYATIYCGANPHRSQEIWQYVSVINHAATGYSWENVANYDFTFRHLMEFNPNRSWASTYNQMWNMSMRDPFPKSSNGKTSGYVQGNSYGTKSSGGGNHAAAGP